MLVAVVGGKLQGVEASYLARKAGWQVMLVDKRAEVPAAGMCDIYRQVDVTDKEKLDSALTEADLVIPALEDDTALDCLWIQAQKRGVPVIFDPDAYAVSSSKLKSNRVFADLGIATPYIWPGCEYPVAAKPSSASGSQGVQLFYDRASLIDHFGGTPPPPGWVVQEYLDGPSYSLEVIGFEGACFPLQVMDLSMDKDFDCKRVTAPSLLQDDLIESFVQLSVSIGRALRLNGVMDVEVILNDGKLHVLEIDARLPSQTPMAVFWSTGLNLLGILGDMWMGKRKYPPKMIASPRGTILEHIQCRNGSLEVSGEHIMTQGGPLHVRQDFFGADEAVTNFESGKDDWVATLIVSGVDRESAWDKRNQVIEQIIEQCSLTGLNDFEPNVL